MHPVASDLTAAPVPPHDGRVSSRNSRRHTWWWRWPENGPEDSTHPARFLRFGSISQTLLTQRTRTAMTNPSGIHDTHTPIAFRSPFLCVERLSGGATQGPIGLWEEGLSGKTTHLCGPCPLRRPVGYRSGFLGNGLSKRHGSGRSKFGRTYGCGMEAMSQFQAEIPHPLVDDLPQLLATGRAGTPTIRSKLLIFIREDDLKGPSVQVKGQHISGGESSLWQESRRRVRTRVDLV